MRKLITASCLILAISGHSTPASAQGCAADVNLLRGLGHQIERVAFYDYSAALQQFGQASVETQQAYDSLTAITRGAQNCTELEHRPNCNVNDVRIILQKAMSLYNQGDQFRRPPFDPPKTPYPQIYSLFVRIENGSSCLVSAEAGANLENCGPVPGYKGWVKNLGNTTGNPPRGQLGWKRDHFLRWFRYTGEGETEYWNTGGVLGNRGYCR